MKNLKILSLLLVATLVLFNGCDHYSGRESSSGHDQYEIQLSMLEQKNKVFIGGSMIVSPDNTDINQLNPGMNIPIKMLEYYYNASGQLVEIPETIKSGVLGFQDVANDYIVFNCIIKDKQGNFIVNQEYIKLLLNEDIDIDNNGTVDLRYETSDRGNGLKINYLKFVSSQSEKYSTLFQLLPEYYPAGKYPSGIAGMNNSGKLLIVKDELQPQLQTRSLTRLANPALASLLRDGDIIIDKKDPNVYSKVGSTNSTVGAKSNQITGQTNNQKVSQEEVFDLMYMEIEGLASELTQGIDNNPHISKKARAKIDVFRKNITLRKRVKNMNIKMTLGVDLDVYIDCKIKKGWGYFDIQLSSYAVLNSSLKGSINVYRSVKMKSWSTKLFTPKMTFVVGPVPIDIKVPIRFGFEANASGNIKLNSGIKYYGKLGFRRLRVSGKLHGLVPKIKYKRPSRVNYHRFTRLPVFINCKASYRAYVYLQAQPDIAPAKLLHARVTTKAGLEGKATRGWNSRDGHYTHLKLDGLIRGKVGVALGYGPFEWRKTITRTFKYRKPLWSKKM